jgi:hypothetical protein
MLHFRFLATTYLEITAEIHESPVSTLPRPWAFRDRQFRRGAWMNSSRDLLRPEVKCQGRFKGGPFGRGSWERTNSGGWCEFHFFPMLKGFNWTGIFHDFPVVMFNFQIFSILVFGMMIWWSFSGKLKPARFDYQPVSERFCKPKIE